MTTESAAITVAIPTFNRRALLEQAVASVLAETRVPVRVSVFDNASSDDTEAFMRGLAARDERVSYHRNERNLGGLRNIESSVASVRTEYFVPLADDDLLLPDFLHDAYAIMQSRPHLGAAVFGTEARTGDDKLVCVYPEYLASAPPGECSPAEHMRLWLRHGHCAWSSVLWRTRVLAHTGAPYAGIGLPGDVDFQARVFAAFPAFLVDRPGAIYRLHDTQASRGFDGTHIPDWAAIFRNLDRSVAASALPWEEYLPLRHVAWERLRGLWNLPAPASLSATQCRRLAITAGFRLGDWPLACSLAARGAGEPKPGALFSLPGPDIDGPGTFQGGGTQALLLSVIRWFADGSARERAARAGAAEAQAACARLEARLQEAEAAAGRLEQEAAGHRAREAARAGEIEALQQRCRIAEDRSLPHLTRRLLGWLTRAAGSRPTSKSS